MLAFLGVIVMPVIALIFLSQKEYIAASGAWIAWSICVLIFEMKKNGERS